MTKIYSIIYSLNKKIPSFIKKLNQTNEIKEKNYNKNEQNNKTIFKKSEKIK